MRAPVVGRRLLPALLVLGCALDRAPPASAYEPARTHAGMTARAAMASGLHATLMKHLGRPLGLLQPLALPATPAAASLRQRLALLDPAQGYAPDASGSEPALAWLEAGSVIEETPPERGLLHYLDPRTGRGLDNAGVLTLGERLRLVVDRGLPLAAALFGEAPDVAGEPSLVWLDAPENDLGVRAFYDHLERSALAEEPAVRDGELARALLAAGAVLHLLEDAGEPSHVRNDYAVAHLLDPPAPKPPGRLSPYEDFVAETMGRLGLPPPGPEWRRSRLRDFFVSAKPGGEPGLADDTQARFFSEGTLPGPVQVPADASAAEATALVRRALVYPSPAPAKLDLAAARSPGGAYLSQGGVAPLALYRVTPSGRLELALDARTEAAYAAVLLPEVEGAAEGLLDFLFRGALEWRAAPGARAQVIDHGGRLAGGTLHVLWEDAHGVRHPLSLATTPRFPAADGDVLGEVASPPAGAVRLVAALRGTDVAGEPLVAIAVTELPLPREAASQPASAPSPP